MSAMQAFYGQLNQSSEAQQPYWASLRRLTRLTHAQVSTFKSDIVWVIWG